MKQEKCCKSCEKGVALHLTRDILCRFNGIVTPDYVCFRYKAAPCQSASRQIELKCIHCENFMVHLDSANENIGRCKLFSERKFDGTVRNVCSKFSKKILIEVS